MNLCSWMATALVFGATLDAATMAVPASIPLAQADGLRALDGEWLYVEDRTEGRASEDQGPPMSPRFSLRVEADAFVLVRRDGEIRMALDGSPTDVSREGRTSRYHGAWKDGAFAYEIEILGADKTVSNRILTEFRPTEEGLLARVEVQSSAGMSSLALYRHPADIALPAPAKASIADLEWLTGAWLGTNSGSSTEERWGPPLGGAMLGTSRTVKNGKMVAFEYLRVVERNGGLVYIAQPGGAPPTEFALTELEGTRAVFENPRHDSPQRIVYELSDELRLSASIGYIRGGRPRLFEFEPEGG